ncbi:MAG: arylsulfatase [Bacteroidetes bacterium]|nr:arylsulfatase [Bacteroidota bacterium]
MTLASGCSQERPPNVIYILADDLGYGELESYGQTLIKTPHLSALASQGIQFTQHYSGSPVCAPSRCTLLTGLHTGHCQVRDNYELGGFADSTERGQLALEKGTFTLGNMMQNAGYTTAIIGKWGLGGPGSTGIPNLQGFDYFYGYLDQKQAHNHYPSHLWRNTEWDTLANGYFHPHQRFDGDDLNDPNQYDQYKGIDYAPDLMADEAESFIRQHADTPFFLYFPHTVPHLALQVPDEELNQYKGILSESAYDGSRGYLPHIRPQSAYAAMITRMDQHIGRIMEVIIELGLSEQTLIIFSSDNGQTYTGGVDIEQFRSSGGLRGGKGEVYEGGIRVPMIAAWPNTIAPGSTTDHVSAFWDIMPTLADLIGTTLTTEVSGVSFLPVLLGHEGLDHSEMYWEYHGRQWGGAQAARIGPWKGVRLGGHNDPSAPVQVFHLENDPTESNDLSRDHPDITQRLLTVMQSRSDAKISRWNFTRK